MYSVVDPTNGFQTCKATAYKASSLVIDVLYVKLTPIIV